MIYVTVLLSVTMHAMANISRLLFDRLYQLLSWGKRKKKLKIKKSHLNETSRIESKSKW